MKPIICPKCAGRLKWEVFDAVHYSVNPVTGRIGAKPVPFGNNPFHDNEPSLVCADCGNVYEPEYNAEAGKVTGIKTKGKE